MWFNNTQNGGYIYIVVVNSYNNFFSISNFDPVKFSPSIGDFWCLQNNYTKLLHT